MMFNHLSRARRSALAALLVFAILALPARARAAEPEAIRLTLDAPPACLVERDLLAQVDALGARARIARDNERARTFEVTITRDAAERYTARFVVHDLVGQQTERTITSPRCADAARSVSLLVAIALDEADATPAAPQGAIGSPSSPAFWPAPANGDTPTAGMRIVRAGRQGSGGLVVTGLYGRSAVPVEGMHVAGARAYAAARVSGGTRVGGSLTLTSDTQREVTDDNSDTRSNGWSGRVGAIIGWGAPWNDTVVGFLGEAGVAGGGRSGTVRSTRTAAGGWTYYDDRGARTSTRFVSPFATASLVLQLPWKAPIRPVAGLSTTAVFGDSSVATLSFTGDLGFVWQAW
jgi:hypothetical protein